MTLMANQKDEWEKWVNERPENVRKVAEKIVPFKKYRDIRIVNDIGNRYSPVSYEEGENGEVTVTCKKTNKDMPILGGLNVFGINPKYLVESDS
jgi:hypothetical protein